MDPLQPACTSSLVDEPHSSIKTINVCLMQFSTPASTAAFSLLLLLMSPPVPSGSLACMRQFGQLKPCRSPATLESSERLGLGSVARLLLGRLCRLPIELRQVVLFELLPIAPNNTHSENRLHRRVSHMYATGIS